MGLTAQSAVPDPGSPAAFDPAPAIAEVRRLIREHYVLPERRPALDAVLAEGLRSGRYSVREPGLFAERVNADLSRVSSDHHLYFRYEPDRVAAMSKRGPENGPPTAMLDDARRSNHGLREQKVLAGNVRYLELSEFAWVGDESRAAHDAAAAFLKGGDAVIIDLRRNGGGSGQAVHQLISHFIAPDRPLISFHKGNEVSPTMRSLPGLSSMVGKPLYVLTSRGTGSAAEEFVGHVAGYKLGEVVGARTSGGAFMNDIFPVDGRFELSVSVARPVLASTGKDWEGTGIAPTIEVPVEEALQAAHAHAIRRLAAADAGRREALNGLADGIDALRRPGTPAASQAAYAGRYGDRRIRAESGRLWLQIEERPLRLMIPMGGNRFTLEDDPAQRLDFQLAGDRAVAFDVGPAGGPVRGRYERTE